MALGVHAQAEVTVAGNEQLRPIVQQMAESLKAPILTWGILVLTEIEWQNLGAKRFHTESAFTIIASRHTFVREIYVRSHSATQIRRTLAHEVGHIMCDCMKESVADQAAATLLE
ncbi:MAG: hypothetical protein DMG32_01730 [Acidobacteria bacterium]|nr:MAG: hypothetical protein DMG32_01730 [Acidobacteriota bacterium]